MADPIPLNTNVAFDQIRSTAEQLIRCSAVVSSARSECGNCEGPIQDKRCRDCGTHIQGVVAYLTGKGSHDDLARQAQAVFPDLPFFGFAGVRYNRIWGDPANRIVLLALSE